jgi:uncharacterized membrane protein
MRPPFSIVYLLLFLFLLGLLLALVQLGLVTIAFDKLGLSLTSALLLLASSLFGSAINLPIFSIKAERSDIRSLPPWPGLLNLPRLPFHGKTIIAVNVGGCLIPVTFSLYLIQLHQLAMADIILATAIVTSMCHLISRPIAGLGIGMPILVAPLTAAITALLINTDHSAPLAYISGTLGVLIGADLLHLKHIRQLGTAVAAIGGAGTFDGIFLTGIIAVLLA